jgi:acyl-CoA hydrolase
MRSTNICFFSPEEVLIGKHVAENLVQDQATLQLGIGRIPNAVLQGLSGHKDLGVHSEMFSDGVMGLIESGIITGRYKTLDTGKLISTFLTGSQKLYDFIDDNQLLEMRDVQYTNNPIIISQHHRMTSINSCIEVDLTGQVVSDSIGTKIFSGVGGQVGLNRHSIFAQFYCLITLLSIVCL